MDDADADQPNGGQTRSPMEPLEAENGREFPPLTHQGEATTRSRSENI
jgi:hypothetical protein